MSLSLRSVSVSSGDDDDGDGGGDGGGGVMVSVVKESVVVLNICIQGPDTSTSTGLVTR